MSAAKKTKRAAARKSPEVTGQTSEIGWSAARNDRFPDHAAKHPTNLSTLCDKLFMLLTGDVATILRKIH